MAHTINVANEKIFSIDEYIDAVSENVDLADEDSIRESAGFLASLNNNKQLAIDALNREIALPPGQAADTKFISHHSMILGNGASKRGNATFVVRMNIWPVLADTAMLQNCRDKVENTFAYGFAHDHNFSLLTAGYFGPGYDTDIYNHNPAAERAEEILVFQERVRLGLGKLLFFCKTSDVHVQHPPESLSVSLNLMPHVSIDNDREQYEFDLGKGGIKNYITGSAITGRLTLIRAAAELGIKEAVPTLVELASHNIVPRVRAASLDALIRLQPVDTAYFAGIGARDPHADVRAVAAAAQKD